MELVKGQGVRGEIRCGRSEQGGGRGIDGEVVAWGAGHVHLGHQDQPATSSQGFCRGAMAPYPI